MLFAIDGKKVRELRGEMTQVELAERAGVSRITVVRVEHGQANALSIANCNRLAEALGVNVGDFVLFKTREQIEHAARQRKRRK
jgi:transcriptional regulator with XRE-family HTH domain